LRRSASASGVGLGAEVGRGVALGDGPAVVAADGLGWLVDGDGAGGAGLVVRDGTQAASQAAMPAAPRPWRNRRRVRTVSRTAAA
jgi:hypothetical protein